MLRVARIAARQHTLITHEQLVAVGIRGSAVSRRVATGRLNRRYRGVYVVGQPSLTREGRWLAAVLASGTGAVLSHLDAAVLWGVYDRTGAKIHVTTAHRSRKGSGDIRLHRVRHLDAEQVTVVNRIPVTTVARMLVDLTDVLGRERLTRIIREAAYRGLLDLDQLDAAITRAHGRRSLPTLRAAVQAHRPSTIIRSELEHRFLELCRTANLPQPDTNVPALVNGKSIRHDCLWPTQGVVVELDGTAAHDRSDAFESDRARDAAVAAAGLRTLRYTWKRISEDADAVAAELRAVLAL